jgi:hypothetical protein
MHGIHGIKIFLQYFKECINNKISVLPTVSVNSVTNYKFKQGNKVSNSNNEPSTLWFPT